MNTISCENMEYKKIECDEVITEENLTDKSRSIRFGGIQEGFSNLTGYIVALDDTHRIVEVLESGCSSEDQEAFLRNNVLFYVGESNKYGCLCGISYPGHVADKVGDFEDVEPDGMAEAFFFKIVR